MNDLDRVKKLAKLLVKQQKDVADLNDKLKAAKKLALSTEREDLPMLMKELELTKFTLESGETISVDDDCDVAITAKTQRGAMAWLTKNDFGGIIKTAVTVEYGSGQKEEAAELYAELLEDDIPATLTEKVHPATLKSFVKEQLAKGAAIPMDLFNIRPFSKVKVTKKETLTKGA